MGHVDHFWRISKSRFLYKFGAIFGDFLNFGAIFGDCFMLQKVGVLPTVRCCCWMISWMRRAMHSGDDDMFFWKGKLLSDTLVFMQGRGIFQP